MNETVMLIGFLLMLFLLIYVLPRILGKGIDAVFEVGKKALFQKQIDDGEQLVNVPLVLTTTASTADLITSLDTVMNACRDKPGLQAVLYETARGADRIAYSYGYNLAPQIAAFEVRIDDRGDARDVVLRVLHATKSEGMLVGADIIRIVRAQVECAVEAAGSPGEAEAARARFSSPDPETPGSLLTKQQMRERWLATGLAVIAIFWLGMGVKISLLPVWGLVAAAAAVLGYRADKVSRANKARMLAGTAEEEKTRPRIWEPATGNAPVLDTSVLEEADDTGSVDAPPVPLVAEAVASDLQRAIVEDQEALPQSMLSDEAARVKLSKRTVTAAAAAVALLLVGFAVFSSVSKGSGAPSDTSFETPPTTQVEQETDIGVEVDPDALSPDTHARTGEDLLYDAPADGSMEFAEVVYADASPGSEGGVDLEFTIVSRSPAEWYILDASDAAYYIDYKEVSDVDYCESANAADARGMVVFNQSGLYELHVFTKGQAAGPATPEKDQVSIVPDFRDFDLTANEWDHMEWADALDAYIARVEKGFADEGLKAVVELRPAEELDEATQEPAAGSSVPAGTRVYIVIPVSD